MSGFEISSDTVGLIFKFADGPFPASLISQLTGRRASSGGHLPRVREDRYPHLHLVHVDKRSSPQACPNFARSRRGGSYRDCGQGAHPILNDGSETKVEINLGAPHCKSSQTLLNKPPTEEFVRISGQMETQYPKLSKWMAINIPDVIICQKLSYDHFSVRSRAAQTCHWPGYAMLQCSSQKPSL